MALTSNDIAALTGAAPAATNDKPQTAGSNKLGKDEFLKLLMTQLQHQDPTAPTDSSAFVAQLAQFTSLELSQTTNSDLESLMMGQAAANQTSLTSFVGRDVLYRTDVLNLDAGKPATAVAQLAGPAQTVTAVIADASGHTVRTMKLGAQPDGPLAIQWDGRDDHGNSLPPGSYRLRVTAMDRDGNSVGVEQRGSGHVTGVAFADGAGQLKIGDVTVKVADVVEINERTGS